jgi:hypothetical protein
MAGDWIKMRLSLQTHPKVVRILSATKSDKFRAIGGLHAVWTVFDTHSVDGRLDGYTAETLDHIIGWNGFSAALIGVGWLVEDGTDALVLPDFDEHNGASGKRRAEDQKRKRDTRKNPQSVRSDAGQNADKKRTREEKRREDKAKRFAPVEELASRGVQPQTASDWLELRKRKKAPVTETALTRIIAEANKAGMSLERALAYGCGRGWTAFEAAWVKDDPASQDQSKAKDWD